jgi:multiple sugar transport system ATP-binding protein
MATIDLEHLSKRYPDGTEAVKSIDLNIGDGEFMILVGPSGCGKSTALRMIAGLEDISDGDVLIDGERVKHLPAPDRDVAMVFQNYALYPHMTVRQNMGFALKLARRPKTEISQRVEEAARILDLEEHLDRKPANLSGGQRQRVAMGRAIVRSPKAFLMDEPLSNLDAKLRVQMRAEVAQLQRRLGTTTIYVTHDQVEAMTLGHRVAVMRGGIIQQVDTPKMLFERPINVFVAGFIGSPSMNFVRATCEDGRLRLPFGDIDTPAGVPARARDIIVGIRPEQFEDAVIAPDKPGLRFTAPVSVVESLGSELYAHLDVSTGPVDASHLAHVTAADGDDDVSAHTVVARLDTESRVHAGAPASLVLDTRHLHLFDPTTGLALSTS